MHLHLDPVGGVAGDMFAAAILDTWPELLPELQSALQVAGLSRLVEVSVQAHKDHALTGSRFIVEPKTDHEHHHDHHHHGHVHDHRSWRDIRQMLNKADLEQGVRQHALAIFELLAVAEGKVHGKAVDDVSFHEVGAWDSIADIVTAAWLIEKLAATSWSCGPLPMGSGWVNSAHGKLSLPAPATALLLEGFPLYQDDLQGERITPTGAAILRYLKPSFEPQRNPRPLKQSGIGFGTKEFPNISNILRLLVFSTETSEWLTDQVAVCQFEIDDQTAEDLAVALTELRKLPGVLDVVQSAVYGKKNRLAQQIQILTEPEVLQTVLTHSFIQTSTLGIRWQIVQRALLKRELAEHTIAEHTIRVKSAQRPGGSMTYKAEMDDISGAEGEHGLASRNTLRRQVEDGG